MASITVGDWFRVTGPKRADGSASWWMGKPGGWQPRAFDGVWPSGQLIRQHVLNIDFSQDFQALEVFRTSESIAKFVQARVEIPDPQGPPGGVRSFWFNVAKYGEDWVTILPQHASGGGSSDQSRSAGGWWSRAAASGVSAEAARTLPRGGGGWSRYEGWAGWGGNRGGAGGPPEAQPEYLCPTCGGAASWEDDIEDGHDHGPRVDPGGCYINCCARCCPLCSAASDVTVESVD